jgi:hypothetical protein
LGRDAAFNDREIAHGSQSSPAKAKRDDNVAPLTF